MMKLPRRVQRGPGKARHCVTSATVYELSILDFAACMYSISKMMSAEQVKRQKVIMR